MTRTDGKTRMRRHDRQCGHGQKAQTQPLGAATTSDHLNTLSTSARKGQGGGYPGAAAQPRTPRDGVSGRCVRRGPRSCESGAFSSPNRGAETHVWTWTAPLLVKGKKALHLKTLQRKKKKRSQLKPSVYFTG